MHRYLSTVQYEVDENHEIKQDKVKADTTVTSINLLVSAELKKPQTFHRCLGLNRAYPRANYFTFRIIGKTG